MARVYVETTIPSFHAEVRTEPDIDEIRRIRHEMSVEYGHDPRRMLAYFASVQDRIKDRLVNFGKPAHSAELGDAREKR